MSRLCSKGGSEIMSDMIDAPTCQRGRWVGGVSEVRGVRARL